MSLIGAWRNLRVRKLDADGTPVGPWRPVALADDPSVLEARIPADLTPWKGMTTVLHDHVVDQPCTERCTTYPRRLQHDDGCACGCRTGYGLEQGT